MKRLFISLATILFAANVFAQTPEKMSYQAVVRNTSDALVANTEVGMQISILQGSTFGASVYVETQTPTTNSNGLVSIEIGGEDATALHGDFSEIDWADGPYFVKIETDPEGGTNYSISGISQLLSVPYALHALTAETVTGGVSEMDPVFAESEAANITADDITNLSNLSGTNTGDQDLSLLATQAALEDSITKIRSEIGTSGDQDFSELATKTALKDSINKVRTEGVYTAGTGISISDNEISLTGSTLAIGDSYKGGIIFWLDDQKEHGLIVATTDQATDVTWANGTNKYTGAAGDGLYSGEMNTAMIVAGQITDTPANFAAKACADYSVAEGDVTYGDWYLPSKYELNLLYQQKAEVTGLSGVYWSSCEHNTNTAHAQDFSDGTLMAQDKQSTTANVRAIRAF